MNYSFIISDMTWSYSRICAYEDCPYRFYLTYIAGVPKARKFFSDYGTFMHDIIRRFLTGQLKESELVSYYLSGFGGEVTGEAPSEKVFNNYFRQGLKYLLNIKPFEGKILGAEKEMHFTVDNKRFVGYIDLLTENDGFLMITDHKSRALKPRSSHRNKPTKSDAELDRYLRQLCLYSIAVKQELGEFPKLLCFNCFRTGELIEEPFRESGRDEAVQWALETIAEIEKEEEWKPDIDWFRCKYLCDVCAECEYFQMFGDER